MNVTNNYFGNHHSIHNNNFYNKINTERNALKNQIFLDFKGEINLNSTNKAFRLNNNKAVDFNENNFRSSLRKSTFWSGSPKDNQVNNIFKSEPNQFKALKNDKSERINHIFFNYGKDYVLNNNITTFANNHKLDSNKQILKQSFSKKNYESEKNISSNHLPSPLTVENKIQRNFLYQNSPNSIKNKSDLMGNYHVQVCSSVKEFAYCEDSNSRYREYMEDFAKCIDRFLGEKERGYFSLFDGHGGDKVAKYVKDRLPEIFDKLLFNGMIGTVDMESIMTQAFKKMDDELEISQSEQMGCTACVVIINREKDFSGLRLTKKVLYCANVGDTRCVLIDKYGVQRISYDHKCTDKDEIDRINKSGGLIFNGRILGQLILTRAFGDTSLKKFGLISVPYINKVVLQDKHTFCVIATDGVWDVLTDEDIYRLSKCVNNSNDFAKLIITTAKSRCSRDNMSCIVIQLK